MRSLPDRIATGNYYFVCLMVKNAFSPPAFNIDSEIVFQHFTLYGASSDKCKPIQQEIKGKLCPYFTF